MFPKYHLLVKESENFVGNFQKSSKFLTLQGKCLFPAKGDLFKVKAGITPKSALTNPIFCWR